MATHDVRAPTQIHGRRESEMEARTRLASSRLPFLTAMDPTSLSKKNRTCREEPPPKGKILELLPLLSSDEMESRTRFG